MRRFGIFLLLLCFSEINEFTNYLNLYYLIHSFTDVHMFTETTPTNIIQVVQYKSNRPISSLTIMTKITQKHYSIS